MHAPASLAAEEANAPPAPRRLVITGSDSRYFPLMQELIASLRRFPALAGLDIGCIDGGLESGQASWLSEQGILLRQPEDFPHVSRRALRKRPSLRIELSKMWLDQLFPGHESLLWIDADAWVQEASAVLSLFQAAEQARQALAIVPEIFLHKPLFRLRWLPFNLVQLRTILYKNARLARLPRALCRSLGVRPTLNGGIFALTRQAPHWQHLRYWQGRVLRYGKIFSSGQLALALTSHHDGLPTALMPAGCNYLGPWQLDPQTGLLCEILFPHRPVGIVHLAGHDAMRLDHAATLEVPEQGGGATHALNLRFPAMRDWQQRCRPSSS